MNLFELEPSWCQVLEEELKKPYMSSLGAFVEREYAQTHPIYPPKKLIFNAFWQTPFAKVKVVLVGQDPYHGPGQAHGLCFSVPVGVPLPPSLQNIGKEIATDLGSSSFKNGCLLKWAQQGVMLLNASLTVRQGEPLSHNRKGWEQFTDAVVAALWQREDPIIFVLWGKSAQEKCKRVKELEKRKHVLLTAAHPSPFSAYNGFFGCRHFSKVNTQLEAWGKSPIDWSID
jgi:uracil-DNA glycosylase